MSRSDVIIDPVGLNAAALALCERLRVEADEQCAYLHRFADGRISLELEWIDPACLAYAVVLAYLDALRSKQSQQ